MIGWFRGLQCVSATLVSAQRGLLSHAGSGKTATLLLSGHMSARLTPGASSPMPAHQRDGVTRGSELRSSVEADATVRPVVRRKQVGES